MGVADIAAFITQFGTPGIMVAYLVWRETAERKDRREKDRLDREENDKDRSLARETNATNIELSRSFVLLTETIRGLK